MHKWAEEKRFLGELKDIRKITDSFDLVMFPVDGRIYGYPLPQAATVALRAMMDWLAEHELPRRVRMVCHTEATAAIYRQTWNLWYAEEKADRI